MRVLLELCILALVAGIVWAVQEVPKRKNMARIECALMAEECQWEAPNRGLAGTLLCVRDKIDKRLEQLAEEGEK